MLFNQNALENEFTIQDDNNYEDKTVRFTTEETDVFSPTSSTSHLKNPTEGKPYPSLFRSYRR